MKKIFLMLLVFLLTVIPQVAVRADDDVPPPPCMVDNNCPPPPGHENEPIALPLKLESSYLPNPYALAKETGRQNRIWKSANFRERLVLYPLNKARVMK